MGRYSLIPVGFLIAIAGFITSCNRDDQSFVIGGVLPLSGDAGSFGQNAAKGAQLAVEEAVSDRALRDTNVKFVAEDSRGDAAGASAAARKLLDFNKANVLIGDVTSAGTHAILPLLQDLSIPLISPAASDPKLTGASPFFARVWPSDVFEAKIIGDYAAQRFKKIAVVFANTDYGVSMVAEFKRLVGMDKVCLDLGLARETIDYRSSISRIRIERCDSVFLVLYPEDMLRFLTQMNESGIQIPRLATATFEDPRLLQVKLAEGVVFASPVPPSDSSPVRRRFLDHYKSRFKQEPGILSDTGYDAARLLIKARAAVGSKGGRTIIDNVKQVRDFDGASGTLSFSATGDVTKPYALRTVRAGKFVVMQ